MSLNMVVTTNLMKLEQVRITDMDGMQGIFIPFRPNSIFKGDKAVIIRWYLLQKEDKFGNPYMVARSLTKTERQNRKQLRFLGSAQYENKLRRYKKPDDDEFDNFEDKNTFE